MTVACPQCKASNPVLETRVITCSACKYIFGVTPAGEVVGATPPVQPAPAPAVEPTPSAAAVPPVPPSVPPAEATEGEAEVDVDVALVEEVAEPGAAPAPQPEPQPPPATDQAPRDDGRAQPDGSERRRFYRIPAIVAVDVQFVSRASGPIDPEVRTATCRDLSESGLRLELRGLPARAAELLQSQQLADLGVLLDINLPKRTLRVSGRVVWSKRVEKPERHLMGIEFVDVAEADGAAIASFARSAVRRPRILRAALAAGIVVLAGFGLLYGWGASKHREAVGELERQLSEANQRYAGVAASLEQQTQELQQVARTVREFAASAANESAETEDVEGDDEAEPIEQLKASVGSLQQTIATVRARADELIQKSAQRKAKGKAKRGKKRP